MPMPLVKSFSGGEVTPEMFGRFDLAKQQTGLARCLNFWVLPHGVAQSRPGFEYVNETKFSNRRSRLIEFSFNSEQTYVLELGHLYCRIHSEGSTLIETPITITGIDLTVPARIFANHNYVNGDWVFIEGITDGPFALNGRWCKVVNAIAGVSFRITDLRDVPISTVGADPWVSGGQCARALELVTPYDESAIELLEINFTQSNDVLTLVHPTYPPAEVRRLGAFSWQYSVISFFPSSPTPSAAPFFSSSVTGANPPVELFYRSSNLATESLEESLPSGISSIVIDLTTVPSYLDIQVSNDPGVDRVNLYKLRNGLFSFVGQTAPGGTIRDTNLAPDPGKTAIFLTQPFNGVDNFPGCVGYFESRRVFAGTNNRPQHYWLTASGSEKNLCYSIPTRDDDSITGRLVAQQANRIRHIAPLAQLLLLTSGGEWKFTVDGASVLTPDSAFPKQDSTEGAAKRKILMPGSGVVFVQEAQSRLRHMAYKWQSNGWSVDDLTIMAPHLFDDYTLEDLAFQKTPFRMVWAARSDGSLLALTFHPEHEVSAWHRHVTDGAVESTACVKEGGDYPLYAIVKRNIGGVDVRLVERMHTRRFPSLTEAFCVDAGITYRGDPTNEVSGLWHLVGETVSLLVDGAVHPARTVDINGAITLLQGVEGSVIHIGLPYICDLQTVPTAFEGVPAAGTAAMKNPSAVYLRVDRSTGLSAGPDFDRLREFPARVTEPYGTPGGLRSGLIEIPVDNDWTLLGHVCVRQAQPLPATVLGMVIDFAAEGA